MATLESATGTLLGGYDQILDNRSTFERMFLGDGLTRLDLERLVTDPDPSIPQELRDAAQFLLDSGASRNFVDAAGSGNGSVDGRISRQDLEAAAAAVKSGEHYDELVESAAGNGPLLFPNTLATTADIEAALLDPAVPEAVKDALRLATLGGDGAYAGLAASSMDAQAYRDAAALYNSKEFAALSAGDQALVAEAFRDGAGSAATTRDLQALLSDPSFQALGATSRSAKLTEFVLLNSPEFRALPASDQTLVTDALANREAGDTGFAAAVKQLVESERFDGLDAAQKTAVLSQVSNYPESSVAANLERVLAKDWFNAQSFDDQQRSLKVVAQMSADDTGDRAILDNTLERLLDPGSDYALKWQDKAPDSNGNITLGWNPHDSHDVYLNSRLMSADNGPVDGGDTTGLGLNTLPHEISHAINDDATDQSFHYLNEEYRAWYVGFQAENGRPPSNLEALERWEYFLNPNGGYAEYAHGIERDFWFDTDGALDKDGEASQIFDLLGDMTGLDVTADNYKDVLASDPSTWKTDPNDPAATHWPGSDDLDN